MNGDRDDEDQCELCGWSVFVFVDHLSFFKISTSNSMLDMVGPLQVIRGRCAFIWMGNVQPMYLMEEEVKTYLCNPSKTKYYDHLTFLLFQLEGGKGEWMNVFCRVFLNTKPFAINGRNEELVGIIWFLILSEYPSEKRGFLNRKNTNRHRDINIYHLSNINLSIETCLMLVLVATPLTALSSSNLLLFTCRSCFSPAEVHKCHLQGVFTQTMPFHGQHCFRSANMFPKDKMISP